MLAENGQCDRDCPNLATRERDGARLCDHHWLLEAEP